MIADFIKGVAAVALAFATSACGTNMHVSLGDKDGVPLADLDKSGAAPTALALASHDRVVVREGDALGIAVSGDADAVAALRFTLNDGRLGIKRARDSDADGRATIDVTMPPARELLLAGSGEITAPKLVEEAEINIAGSGKVAVADVSARDLRINLMGSGTLDAAGRAETLALNVAGSGRLNARALKVESAIIKIAGSGSGEFASDGTVDAKVAGSGEVTVLGRANCKISAVGSGTLRCHNPDPAAPQAPATATP